MLPTTYTNAKELSKLDRWNVTRVILEAKAKRPTFYRLMKDPVSLPDPHNEISMRILKLHRINIPSPLGALQAVADEVHLLQQSLPTEDYERFLLSQLGLVKIKLPDNLETIEDAGICYLYGLIGYQLRFSLKCKDSKVPSVKEISAAYKKAHDRLKNEGGTHRILALKTAMTSIVIEFMSRPVKTRSVSDDEIRQRILDENFLNMAEEILEYEEWCWKAARNGLIGASVLQDAEKCKFFWAALNNAHPSFEDPDYTPQGLPSIRKDPDAWWFVENILTE